LAVSGESCPVAERLRLDAAFEQFSQVGVTLCEKSSDLLARRSPARTANRAGLEIGLQQCFNLNETIQ
jgi:hypothetical protein